VIHHALISCALSLSLVAAVWADHGTAATRSGGASGPWLVATAIAAVLAAVAWALFGPGARDPDEDETASAESETRARSERDARP
jgi:hypothetical protein